MDILLAELSELPFDSFEEVDSQLIAYILASQWKTNLLQSVELLKNPEFKSSYTISEVPKINWNAQWEANFNPIVVRNYTIRASFHPPKQTQYEILIEPKMSFGTGHHETTQLMFEMVLQHSLKGKRVLDMGCGTGILAIGAKLRGASKVTAIDIEPWCVQNTIENAAKNQCPILVLRGDSSMILETFDCIFANINRNILLQDMTIYKKALAPDGMLFLSGFYHEDLEDISACCSSNDLRLDTFTKKNNWICSKYVNS